MKYGLISFSRDDLCKYDGNISSKKNFKNVFSLSLYYNQLNAHLIEILLCPLEIGNKVVCHLFVDVTTLERKHLKNIREMRK